MSKSAKDDTHRLTREKTADTDHPSPTAPLPDSSAKTKRGRKRVQLSCRGNENRPPPIHSCIGGKREGVAGESAGCRQSLPNREGYLILIPPLPPRHPQRDLDTPSKNGLHKVRYCFLVAAGDRCGRVGSDGEKRMRWMSGHLFGWAFVEAPLVRSLSPLAPTFPPTPPVRAWNVWNSFVDDGGSVHRLYSKGRVLGHKRAKRNSSPNTSLLQIEGVGSKEDAQFYLGKVHRSPAFPIHKS